jgi:hypothetical protein
MLRWIGVFLCIAADWAQYAWAVLLIRWLSS